MLQIGLILGFVAGFLLRGWLERTFPWIFRLFRKGQKGPDGKPQGWLDRARALKDRFLGKSKDDDRDPPGGKR